MNPVEGIMYFLTALVALWIFLAGFGCGVFLIAHYTEKDRRLRNERRVRRAEWITLDEWNGTK
jgi:hypothetical protein